LALGIGHSAPRKCIQRHGQIDELSHQTNVSNIGHPELIHVRHDQLLRQIRIHHEIVIGNGVFTAIFQLNAPWRWGSASRPLLHFFRADPVQNRDAGSVSAFRIATDNLGAQSKE